jgi:hypothetical protein
MEKDTALDNHVRRVLTSDRKAKLKQMMAGLWVFLKTPMGIVTAIYGFLVVFWGAAIVLFLAGWINAGSDEWQDIWVGECSENPERSADKTVFSSLLSLIPLT